MLGHNTWFGFAMATANVVLDQIDETKKGLYTVVAKEIRDFLQSTNFAADVRKVLTGLAFEVKMEVRFKSTEDEAGRQVVRPDVSADVPPTRLNAFAARLKMTHAPFVWHLAILVW